MPVMSKQSFLRMLPHLQKQAGTEPTCLMFGIASAVAATFQAAARRSFKQRHRCRLKRVPLAQQMSNTSPAGQTPFKSWQDRWKAVLLEDLLNQSEAVEVPVSPWPGKDSSHKLSRNDKEQHADEQELRRLISRQRVTNKDYLNQVMVHISNRRSPLEKLRLELEQFEARNAALTERLQKNM